ncbi:unnamed protein product [Closterium sp. NIES-64]|nr:unnamed protein product [Closterium sp. NIES-64]
MGLLLRLNCCTRSREREKKAGAGENMRVRVQLCATAYVGQRRAGQGLLAGSRGARGRGCSRAEGAGGAGAARGQQGRAGQGLLARSKARVACRAAGHSRGARWAGNRAARMQAAQVERRADACGPRVQAAQAAHGVARRSPAERRAGARGRL